MNTEPETTEPADKQSEKNDKSTATPKKKPLLSIPFLIIAVVLIAGGYPAGKWVMKQVITMQEEAKASGEAIPPDEDVSRPGDDMSEQTNTVGRGGRNPGAGDDDSNGD